jgi:hypothetical protein
MRWSSSAGKFGGFAKLGSGSPQAANLFGRDARSTVSGGVEAVELLPVRVENAFWRVGENSYQRS